MKLRCYLTAAVEHKLLTSALFVRKASLGAGDVFQSVLSEGMFVLLTVQGLIKHDNLTNFGLRLKPLLLLLLNYFHT